MAEYINVQKGILRMDSNVYPSPAAFYGPYASVDAAYTDISGQLGELIPIGLKFGVKTTKGFSEYCFKTGITKDDICLSGAYDDERSGSGKDYVVIRKGISATDLLYAINETENTIFEIRYEFDLDGETIEPGTGCTLLFTGGKLKNGKLTPNNTAVVATSEYAIMQDVLITDDSCLGDGYTWMFEDTQRTDDYMALFNVVKFEHSHLSKDINLESWDNPYQEGSIIPIYINYNSLDLDGNSHRINMLANVGSDGRKIAKIDSTGVGFNNYLMTSSNAEYIFVRNVSIIDDASINGSGCDLTSPRYSGTLTDGTTYSNKLIRTAFIAVTHNATSGININFLNVTVRSNAKFFRGESYTIDSKYPLTHKNCNYYCNSDFVQELFSPSYDFGMKGVCTDEVFDGCTFRKDTSASMISDSGARGSLYFNNCNFYSESYIVGVFETLCSARFNNCSFHNVSPMYALSPWPIERQYLSCIGSTFKFTVGDFAWDLSGKFMSAEYDNCYIDFMNNNKGLVYVCGGKTGTGSDARPELHMRGCIVQVGQTNMSGYPFGIYQQRTESGTKDNIDLFEAIDCVFSEGFYVLADRMNIHNCHSANQMLCSQFDKFIDFYKLIYPENIPLCYFNATDYSGSGVCENRLLKTTDSTESITIKDTWGIKFTYPYICFNFQLYWDGVSVPSGEIIVYFGDDTTTQQYYAKMSFDTTKGYFYIHNVSDNTGFRIDFYLIPGLHNYLASINLDESKYTVNCELDGVDIQQNSIGTLTASSFQSLKITSATARLTGNLQLRSMVIRNAFIKLLHYPNNGVKTKAPDRFYNQTAGTFANVPKYPEVGFRYFCTDKQTSEGATNGIVIYHKGNNVWVDALGRTVTA